MIDDTNQPTAAPARLNPTASNFITIIGPKKSGKSILAQLHWHTWARHRLCIDPTGDVWGQVHTDGESTKLEDPLPLAWRAGDEHRRSSLVYVPDVGADDYAQNLDRAVGLAFARKGSLLWIDEAAELTRANKTLPHYRRALHQGRHRGLNLLQVCPRPIDVDTMVMSQADVVFAFRLPHPRDRERLAGVSGIEPRQLDEMMGDLAEHEYLRIELTRHIDDPNRVVHYARLPDPVVSMLKAVPPAASPVAI